MRYNITDYAAGDTLIIAATLLGSDQEPIDLTGATLQWGVAAATTRTLGAALVTKTVGDGITVVDADAGEVRITLDKGDLPTAGDYHHELEVTLASGESYTLLYGKIVAVRALFAE